MGVDHPFAVADRSLRDAVRTLGLTSLFVVALATFAYPDRSATVLASAAFVLLYLVLRLVLLADEREELAMELVIQGGEALPIPAVIRLRRSLLGHRRDQMRRSLLRLLDQATAQARCHPDERRAAILDVAGEVVEVADLLQRTQSARAVALTQRLVGTAAGWHMLAFEQARLMQELGRIRFLLLADASGSRTSSPTR